MTSPTNVLKAIELSWTPTCEGFKEHDENTSTEIIAICTYVRGGCLYGEVNSTVRIVGR